MNQNELEGIGSQLKELRESNHFTQQKISEKLGIDRSYVSKIENGVCDTPYEILEKYAQIFNIDINKLLNIANIIVPDTCSLLKNPNILYELINNFHSLVVPVTVMNELDWRSKQKNKKRGKALKAIWVINELLDNDENQQKIKIWNAKKTRTRYLQNDDKIIATARALSAKENRKVIILSEDKCIKAKFNNTITLNEYNQIYKENTSSRGQKEEILFDSVYLDDYSNYKRSPLVNINAIMDDGQSILIHTIRSNHKNKYKKLKYLIESGVDVNLNDESKYFLPPLAHCVQKNDLRAFKMLLEAGADCNRGSIIPSDISYISRQNEHNNSLMIAAWHGRTEFIKVLEKQPDLSLNQQDANGFTALIKAAIHYFKEKDKEAYDYLLSIGADPLIRDNKGHTAEYYLTHPIESR